MRCLLHFSGYSGVVQLVAQRPLEPFILVRVQAPEPFQVNRMRGFTVASPAMYRC
jgi:hypothetical protein